MSVTATPIFPQTVQSLANQIANATTTTLVTLYTAGTNGSRIENVSITSTNVANNNIQIYANNATANYLLGTVQVLANSGQTNSVPTISLFAATNFLSLNKDSNGNPYMYLATGFKLVANSTTSLVTGNTINFFTQGGDY